MSYPDRIRWVDSDGGRHSISGPLADAFAKRMDASSQIKYYDRDGNQIGFGVYARLFENLSYKRVAEDYVGPLWISTVWLGLDHSFNFLREDDNDYKPVIFETMAFPSRLGDPPPPYSDDWQVRFDWERARWKAMPKGLQEFEGEQQRYSTLEEAKRGQVQWATKARTILIESERN